MNQKKAVSLVILLLGVLGSIDARKHKRNCQTTQPACDSATTTTQTPTCTAGSSTTAVTTDVTTVAPLKSKGEPCKMNSDCLANLACDIRIEPRQYICTNIQNGTCDTWLDCANNLQCVNGQCGCYV